MQIWHIYCISKYIIIILQTLQNVMNYTLNQLRIFLKIVQKQSITRAAEELFLTQPAVSIQLKNFQDQLQSIILHWFVDLQVYV